MAPSTPAPVTVVVLTHQEELNLGPCLASVAGWVQDIFTVDSGSTDRTNALAVERGARVFEHPFETHATQWAWALEHLPISTPWVLGLDADQRVTPELRASIEQAVRRGPAEINGYYMTRRQIFRGRWIRFGGYYPKYLLKLFRIHSVRTSEADLVDHHFIVDGRTERLHGDLIEDNKREDDIGFWIAKHNRYAGLMAREEVTRSRESVPLTRATLRNPDARTAYLKSIWKALPLYVRPLLYFFYRYFLRLGFLDGKQGFIFHFMQALWFRLLVDVNVDSLRSGLTPPASRREERESSGELTARARRS